MRRRLEPVLSLTLIGLVSLTFLLVTGPLSLAVAEPRIRLVTNQGKTVSGTLLTVQRNTVRLRARGLDLKFSLQSLEKLSFGRSKLQGNGASSTAELRDGERFAFRRLIASEQNGLTFRLMDGTRRTVPFSELQTVYLGNQPKSYRITLRGNPGDTRTVQYRTENQTTFSGGGENWTATRKGNNIDCSLPPSVASDTQPRTLRLWSLPPDPGNTWTITQGGVVRGNGKWMRRSNNKRAQRKGTIPFRINLNLLGHPPTTINGAFDTRALIPVKFTVSNRNRSTDWSIVELPSQITFTPCLLVTFL